LEDLGPILIESGFNPHFIRLDFDHRTFGRRLIGELVGQLTSGDVILFDGAEQLSSMVKIQPDKVWVKSALDQNWAQVLQQRGFARTMRSHQSTLASQGLPSSNQLLLGYPIQAITHPQNAFTSKRIVPGAHVADSCFDQRVFIDSHRCAGP